MHNKMKKFAALLLALVMVFALAACGGDAGTPTAQPTESAQPSESAQPGEQPSETPDGGEAEASVWDGALYAEDTELGEGASTI